MTIAIGIHIEKCLQSISLTFTMPSYFLPKLLQISLDLFVVVVWCLGDLNFIIFTELDFSVSKCTII